MPARRVACADCGRSRDIRSENVKRQAANGFRCRPCSYRKRFAASRVRQARPGSAPGRVVIDCPDCGARRDVHASQMYRDAKCRSCADRAPAVGNLERHAMADRARFGLHPMPEARSLSFDLDALVAEYRGPVRRLPTADLREPDFVPVKPGVLYDETGFPVLAERGPAK